jgi:glycosyltransferase involved in cell wall biosynthesis
MAGNVKVSVCMATYQGEAYVHEQLESVLSQLAADDEVVVSDDCSTDATVAVVDGLDDPRIRVLRGARNVGYSKNFARALAASTGDVIFICDQDDVWLPGKVDTMLEALRGRDMVVADVTVVDQDLNVLEDSHFQRHRVKTGFLTNFAQTRYIGASMAMRRPVLDLSLPLPSNAKYCAYDYWITLVGEAFFDVGLVRTPQMLYRRHGSNASTGGSTSGNSLGPRSRVRVYCLVHLLLRSRRALGAHREP